MEVEMMRVSALLFGVLCVTAAPGVVSTAAAQNRTSDAGQWEVPRTPDGHPDFQGNWSNSTLTPFERREGEGRSTPGGSRPTRTTTGGPLHQRDRAE